MSRNIRDSKILVIRVLSILLISICLISLVPDKSASLSASASAVTLKNIVIFVNFSDTVHNHVQSAWGKCFMEDANITELWTGTDRPKSLASYISNISYGQTKVTSIFPQLGNNNAVTPYNLSKTSSYYSQNKDAFVSDILDILIASGKIASNENVDGNSDGCLDNLTIVVPCESYNSNEDWYGLAAWYSGNQKINGKSVRRYNIITESGAYLSSGQSGLIIHEFMHTLGYPDLYRASNSTVCNPVGLWDVMSSESTYVQFPLAYLRSTIGKYFTIPTVTTNQTGYTLYSPASTMTNSAHANSQAVIIKTPLSDTEFFVVEYREKAPQYVGGKYNSDAYDRMIYGSGLIVYRVNIGLETLTNHTYSDPYFIYVFRPNETFANSFGDGAGDLTKSFLSSESGRTSLTGLKYSDGTDSGITISNVGSASGSSISFNISIDKSLTQNYWSQVSLSSQTGAMLDSCQIGSDLYSILYDYSGTGKLFKLSNAFTASPSSTWTEVCSLPLGYDFKLCAAGNTIYLGYLNSAFHPTIAKLSGTSWSTIFTSTHESNGTAFNIAPTTGGVYLTYFEDSMGSTKKLHTYKITSSLAELQTITGTKNGANPSISVLGTNLVVSYREWDNQNKLRIFKLSGSAFTELSNSLSSEFPVSFYGSSGIAVFSTSSGIPSAYRFDSSNSVFRKMGNNLSQNSISDGAFAEYGSTLYSLVSSSTGTQNDFAVQYYDGEVWKKLGNSVDISTTISCIDCFTANSNIYVVYLAGSKISVKKHSLASSGATPTPTFKPSATPSSTISAKPSATPSSTTSAKPLATPAPTSTPWSSVTPNIANTDLPLSTPNPTSIVLPSESPISTGGSLSPSAPNDSSEISSSVSPNLETTKSPSISANPSETTKPSILEKEQENSNLPIIVILSAVIAIILVIIGIIFFKKRKDCQK